MLNEAAAAARLSHPNTVVIHDYGHLDDGRCFIAMELLDGVTLQDRIAREGPLDPEDAVHVALQVTGSLFEAHEAGMIHRDLKPGNVMLTRKGKDDLFVKVVDFGLVKNDPKDAAVDESGALVGTPRYMAPEQVVSERVSPATDVYGLGATLYHALTGRPPFESDSRFVLMAAHVTTAPKAMSEVLAEVDSEVPPALEAVVMRCLQKEPGDRYHSMSELADALAESLGDSVPSTLRASLPSGPVHVDRVMLTASAEADALAETLDAPARRSRPMLWGALAVLALGAAIGAVALASGAFDRPAPAVAAPTPLAPEPAPEPELEPEPVVEATSPPDPGATTLAIREVTITVEPEHATVLRGDDDLGNAPLTLAIPEGERWTLEVQAPGYASREITLTGAQRELRVRLQRQRRTPPSRRGSTSTRRRSDNRDPWAEDRAP